MAESHPLDYAAPPPNQPAHPCRLAVGATGAVVYAAATAMFLVGVVNNLRDVRGDVGQSTVNAAFCGLVAAACGWRLSAAIRHLASGVGRRRRG